MDVHVLDTIDMSRLGRELQRARKRKGLTQEEAARLIGATRTTMVAIEKGERRIKSGELITLARAYDSQVNDFVRPRPDIEQLDVQFRGPWIHTDEDDKDIRPAINEFEDLCRNYLELEILTDSPMVRKYPSEYQIWGLPVEPTAETIAMEERSRLGLGDRPISILRDVLEQEVGLRVFYLPMPPRFSEIYAYTEQLGGCLAINIVHPEERRRWSMAHGYFHFLSTRMKAEIDAEGAYQRQPESERFADAFARHFLMPSAGLLRRFNEAKQQGQVTPSTLCTWANYYGVSVEAITRRLESMHLLASGTWEKINRSIKIRQLQRQLGLEAIPAREQTHPARFKYLAFEAFRAGQISEGQFARFLEIDRLEARRILQESVRQPEGDTTGNYEQQSQDWPNLLGE